MSSDFLTAGAQERARAARADATCAAPSCWSSGERVRVGGREAVLCETHRKAFLGVSS
jgi:hypothetical protein